LVAAAGSPMVLLTGMPHEADVSLRGSTLELAAPAD
jgi:hypothetical protein